VGDGERRVATTTTTTATTVLQSSLFYITTDRIKLLNIPALNEMEKKTSGPGTTLFFEDPNRVNVSFPPSIARSRFAMHLAHFLTGTIGIPEIRLDPEDACREPRASEAGVRGYVG